MRPNTDRGREKRKRRTRMRLCLGFKKNQNTVFVVDAMRLGA